MRKIVGISGLLVFICVATSIINPNFMTAYNLENILRWTGLLGILAIGASFVIVTGGIDLSMGSVVGLTGCLLPWLIVKKDWPVVVALLAVMAVSLLIGLVHGLLITGLRLQPFIVTLCGLMVYRGVGRYFTGDSTQGFGNDHETLRLLTTYKLPLGFIGIPSTILILAVFGIAAAIFMHRTVWGRYLLALGRNEEAARFSGIHTDRMKILAYMICALLGGIGGMLFSIDVNGVQPSSQGQGYELYAIAAAVLGGCSLRGGEISVLGVIIGAAVMRSLYTAINLVGIQTSQEFTVIGTVILLGVIADEVFRRLNDARRARQAATLLRPTEAPAAAA